MGLMPRNIYFLLTVFHYKAKRSSKQVQGSKGEVNGTVEEMSATSRRRKVRRGGQQEGRIVTGCRGKKVIRLMGTDHKYRQETV